MFGALCLHQYSCGFAPEAEGDCKERVYVRTCTGSTSVSETNRKCDMYMV